LVAEVSKQGGLKKEKAQAGASRRLGMHEVDLTAKNRSFLLLAEHEDKFADASLENI
jgi:hypothetical protein